MDTVLLHPCYFGPISEFAALSQAKNVIFEHADNFQKQTYRNRMYVYGANGRLLLNIPIKHTGNKSQHQKYKEVKIENQFNWQTQHWKSLQTIYRTSPFFEFYEDDFYPLYHNSYKYLLDFNYKCLELVLDCLQLDLDYSQTTVYEPNPESVVDLRFLVDAKRKKSQEMEEYNQVFATKFGYLNDLSIVDLIFNLGPESLQYLENQKLDLL